MKKCATGDESAAWAKASGAATAKVTQHPLWVVVDGKQVSDDSYGTQYWAASVLKAVCSAASTKGLAIPAACQSANNDADALLTPM